ncbi:MAG: AAA family ATPase [Dongiaceae bacterium]
MWSQTLFGDCPPWLIAEGDRRHYDLYLLCDVDEAPAPGHQFQMPGDRREQFAMFKQALVSRDRPFVHLHGGWDAKFAVARQAVAALIAA